MVAANTTVPTSSTVLPNGATVSSKPPEIVMGPDGRITGIDGMLSQIAGALAREAAPVIRAEILPVLQQDRETQRTLGAAAGKSLAQELRPWVAVGAGALAVIAAVKVAKLVAGG
jgi:hypothetical protein